MTISGEKIPFVLGQAGKGIAFRTFFPTEPIELQKEIKMPTREQLLDIVSRGKHDKFDIDLVSFEGGRAIYLCVSTDGCINYRSDGYKDN